MFSQEELIALMQSDISGGYQPPNLLIYTEPFITVSGSLNSLVQFTIKGHGFTPDIEIMILGVQVAEFLVVNFFECRVTIQVSSYETFPVSFYSNNQLIPGYGVTQLTVTPPFPPTNWFDYRTYRNFSVMSRLATAPTTNLASAGLQIGSNGLFTTSSGSSLFVIFPTLEIPPNTIYRHESIATFSSGSFAVWSGLSRVPNWDNPRQPCLIMNALENRSYSRIYYGFNSYYKATDKITGTNWLPSFIHTVIEVGSENITLSAYGRSTLSYDWNNAADGELIFSESINRPEDLAECYPAFFFQSASSTSYLVAQRLN